MSRDLERMFEIESREDRIVIVLLGAVIEPDACKGCSGPLLPGLPDTGLIQHSTVREGYDIVGAGLEFLRIACGQRPELAAPVDVRGFGWCRFSEASIRIGDGAATFAGSRMEAVVEFHETVEERLDLFLRGDPPAALAISSGIHFVNAQATGDVAEAWERAKAVLVANCR